MSKPVGHGRRGQKEKVELWVQSLALLRRWKVEGIEVALVDNVESVLERTQGRHKKMN